MAVNERREGRIRGSKFFWKLTFSRITGQTHCAKNQETGSEDAVC